VLGSINYDRNLVTVNAVGTMRKYLKNSEKRLSENEYCEIKPFKAMSNNILLYKGRLEISISCASRKPVVKSKGFFF
jgi:hypothetical protein